MVESNDNIDFEPLFWAASTENKNKETRDMAKEILDTLCFIQNMGAAK